MTLTTLIKRLSTDPDLTDRLIKLGRIQDSIITAQGQLIRSLQKERNELQLDFAREMQGLFAAWLISLEMPEEDMRETLVAAEQAIGMKIATLEEHIL